MTIRGKGFIVLTDDSNVPEYTSVAEAQDEAIRLYVSRSRNARVILYAPIAVISPKIDKDTELKFTPFAERVNLVPKADELEQQALAEVEDLLADKPKKLNGETDKK